MTSMWRSRLLCAIALGLGAAIAAVSQTASPASLPAPLRDHVKAERFQLVTAIRGLPLGVRDELQKLFGSQTLDIAEPTAEFRTAGATAERPLRRLIAAACSMDHCLVHYERSANDHTWLVGLFHWTPAETRVEWSGYARGRLATTDDVRNAVLSGTIKSPVTLW